MTIQEYLNAPQIIDDEITEEGIYANFAVINIIPSPAPYFRADIHVKCIAENTYAFGWDIQEGNKQAMRPCSPTITNKGNIAKLLYGMTKVLKNKATAARMSWNLVNVICEASKEMENVLAKVA